MKQNGEPRHGPPPRRDFQDADPPKTLEELYGRYDPRVGAGLAIFLGSFLVYLLARISRRYLVRNVRRYLRRSKIFGKYFDQSDLPPFEMLLKIAQQQRAEIPESIVKQYLHGGYDVTSFEKGAKTEAGKNTDSVDSNSQIDNARKAVRGSIPADPYIVMQPTIPGRPPRSRQFPCVNLPTNQRRRGENFGNRPKAVIFEQPKRPKLTDVPAAKGSSGNKPRRQLEFCDPPLFFLSAVQPLAGENFTSILNLVSSE